MDKSVIERCCRNAGLKPERKLEMQGMELYIADGFTANPHEAFWRFGIDKGEFPFGCFVTMWWTAKGEDQFDIGVPLFFEAFHNPELPGQDVKKMARINTAIKEASGFLKRRKKAKANA